MKYLKHLLLNINVAFKDVRWQHITDHLAHGFFPSKELKHHKH